MIAFWSVKSHSKAIKVHGIPTGFNESWSQATAWNIFLISLKKNLKYFKKNIFNPFFLICFLITKQSHPQYPPLASMQDNTWLCCCKPTFCSWRKTVHNLLFSFLKGKKAKHVYNLKSKFSVLLLWWGVLSLLKLIQKELLIRCYFWYRRAF